MYRSTLAALAALGAFVSACHDEPVMGGGVAWVEGAAEARNGQAPTLTAAAICGSDTETYLKELLDTAPTNAKVLQEWGDCVLGGQQVMVQGSVATTHLGPTDLPMSHPYGDDLSMNIDLLPQYLAFAQKLGSVPGEETDNQIHVEISGGFIPHIPHEGGPPTGELYRAAADRNLDRSLYQTGFAEPRLGSPILIMGRWIIDCGHENYSAELHAISFLAWSESFERKTTVRTYFNPYRDSERYNPDKTSLGHVSDESRFTLSDTQPFPPFLVREVARILNNEIDHLRSLELIDATIASPVDWRVCAPSGTAGNRLVTSWDIVKRPGVTFSVTPEPATGCAVVHSVLEADYAPLDAAMRTCVLPWTYLNEIAATQTGGGSLDIAGVIKSYVPEQYWPMIDNDPEASCADALSGPAVDTNPVGQNIRTDDTQPFPFYGVVSVEWAD